MVLNHANRLKTNSGWQDFLASIGGGVDIRA